MFWSEYVENFILVILHWVDKKKLDIIRYNDKNKLSLKSFITKIRYR